jgi:hypothetical protein
MISEAILTSMHTSLPFSDVGLHVKSAASHLGVDVISVVYNDLSLVDTLDNAPAQIPGHVDADYCHKEAWQQCRHHAFCRG